MLGDGALSAEGLVVRRSRYLLNSAKPLPVTFSDLSSGPLVTVT